MASSFLAGSPVLFIALDQEMLGDLLRNRIKFIGSVICIPQYMCILLNAKYTVHNRQIRKRQMRKLNYNQKPVTIEEPNICPHCHVVMTPIFIWEDFSLDTDDCVVYLSAWKCSNQKCRKIFMAQYFIHDNVGEFSRYLNGLPKGPDWPRPILELKSGADSTEVDNKNGGKEEHASQSSNFIKTYLQSLQAENYGLDEIAGMGYRKAIEYLVKDWAIQNNQNASDKIKDMWLSAVISEYYSGDLKEILERATWIGNDQAHYNKIFQNFDVNILKELIDLIMVELDRQHKKNHYIQAIKKKNK